MLKEFFGFGGFSREPEGWFSWQHITFVTSLMVIMVALAIILGRKNKNSSDKATVTGSRKIIHLTVKNLHGRRYAVCKISLRPKSQLEVNEP